jgi:hypothetical protein
MLEGKVSESGFVGWSDYQEKDWKGITPRHKVLFDLLLSR